MGRSVDRQAAVADGRQSCKPFAYPLHRCPEGPEPPGRREDAQRFFGLSMVPVQFFEPQRQAQIFFRRAVWGSSRVMP